MEELLVYISPELTVLTVGLYCLGLFCKSNSLIKDEYIPFIILIFSTIAAILIKGFCINSVLEGIICATVAVFAENIRKQVIKISKEE